jgi:hypothetical protein
LPRPRPSTAPTSCDTENGWALHGLAEFPRRRDARAETEQLDARFARAWQRAQVEIASSCFCRRG